MNVRGTLVFVLVNHKGPTNITGGVFSNVQTPIALVNKSMQEYADTVWIKTTNEHCLFWNGKVIFTITQTIHYYTSWWDCIRSIFRTTKLKIEI